MAPERKNVTVLFADISGFTAMSEKLDPEEVTTIMNNCLGMMAECVTRYEGYVDKFIGDCIMAIFGAPVTHENDPELAVRAALDMLKGIEDQNTKVPVKLEKPLALHIGINTGVAIAGGVGYDQKMDYTVMGDTVNLASRLESNAGDGQIYVSSYTYNMTRTQFKFIRHDPIKVKGKKDPVAIFQVTSALPTKAKTGAGELVPMVGRSQELADLQACCESLADGKGQTVLLVSEPGIGKSRLLDEMRTHIGDLPCQLLEGNCRSFGDAMSFYVFVDMFKQLLDIEAEDLEDLMAAKVSDNLPLLLNLDKGRLEPDAREAIVFIGAMLALDLSEDFDVHIEEMDGQQFNDGTFKAVCWFFRQLANLKPLILILENIHFAGQSSIELMQEILNLTADSPIIVIVSMRPTKDHASSSLLDTISQLPEGNATQISLDPLEDAEVDLLARRVLKAEEVPDDLLALIRDRARGNPLYVEEITQNLLEDGAIERSDEKRVRVVKALDTIEMPTAIQGLILSRADKLQPALKELLRLASVIGPVFAYELIHRLAEKSELDAQLMQLSDLGMIIETKAFPAVEYSFRNILIQEAIYSELMHAQRRELHASVAEAIEEMYATHLQDQYEVLANHYQQAEKWEKAFDFTVKSGFKAREAYSSGLAKRNFTAALEIGQKLELPAENLIKNSNSPVRALGNGGRYG